MSPEEPLPWNPLTDPGALARGEHHQKLVLVTIDLFAPEHVGEDRGEPVSLVDFRHSGRRINGSYTTFVWDASARYVVPTRHAALMRGVLRVSGGYDPEGRSPLSTEYRDFAENLVPALRALTRGDVTAADMAALALTPAAERALVLGTDEAPEIVMLPSHGDGERTGT